MKYRIQVLIAAIVITVAVFGFQQDQRSNETAMLAPVAEENVDLGPCGPCNDGWRVCDCGTQMCVEQCTPPKPKENN